MLIETREPSPVAGAVRPRACGKSIWVRGEKLVIKGVTYGTFRPDSDGEEFHDWAKVEADFEAMARHGFTAVRVYTTPPRWLLDLAARHGLYVMVGLPWEQHVAFLDTPGLADDIVRRVRQGVRSCAGHPAVLAFAIGNEIPASIVRWHGAAKVERFLRRLRNVVKQEDPQSLVTYVNFPTTEYLNLPFVDLNCFNVYLEDPEKLEAYLARLHNLGGDKPLVMAEIGLDSRRNGLQKQATTLDWQISTAFESGCAGAFIFSWTDEWHRGGQDIEDWDFGLTDRDRNPKPALAATTAAFAATPFPASANWPRVSAVVCSYNGSATIAETLEQLTRLNYPDYEVIVVNDGSTDATEEIAARFEQIRLISVANGGLSRARNLGWEAATGEIVAYIDDDAYPDPDWLLYLAHTFQTTNFAGVGGPNIPPPGDGPVAACVAASPGGPAHVLLTDKVAEHIPGCNMAFRREALAAIGGFDPQFRVAGDDVDVCWRLQERGRQLGFHPAAVVWHHRRPSIRKYWKQQKGYGKAEALLKHKWPEKYNAHSHVSWSGRVYGAVAVPVNCFASRIYHGVWNSAAFQSLYERTPGTWGSLPLIPEWYLMLAVLLIAGALGLLWRPMLVAWGFFAAGAGVSVVQSLANGLDRREFRWRHRLLTAYLYGIQPLARLVGRIRHGIAPWKLHGSRGFTLPVPRETSIWSIRWRGPADWLAAIEKALQRQGAVVSRGDAFDRWDLQVQCGITGGVRVAMAVEEHGAGQQLLRFRFRPFLSRFAVLLVAATWVLSALAWRDSADAAVVVLLAASGALLLGRIIFEAGCAKLGSLKTIRALDHRPAETESSPEGPRELGGAAAR